MSVLSVVRTREGGRAIDRRRLCAVGGGRPAEHAEAVAALIGLAIATRAEIERRLLVTHVVDLAGLGSAAPCDRRRRRRRASRQDDLGAEQALALHQIEQHGGMGARQANTAMRRRRTE